MPDSAVSRAGTILAVSDFAASPRFYRDAELARKVLSSRGVRFLAETYRPPWGGSRFYCVDPDGYLIEIEQPRLSFPAAFPGALSMITKDLVRLGVLNPS